MILIADSGSTKCDWALADASGKTIKVLNTIGLNPYFHSAENVEMEICKNRELAELSGEVENIFFYGSGCSNDKLKGIIREGVKSVFPNAKIEVDHDMVAAAYATYTGEPCISCILGTGSNSCHFDGEEVYEEVPSLAYIVGDEASGSYFGKILLREFFYKRLPLEIHEDFEREFKLDKNEFLERVYRQPHANVYLASFTNFIGKHKEHPHIQKWLVNGMREFLRYHVLCFPDGHNVPVHFIGSVAHHFSACLEVACLEEEVELGRIVQKPLENLVKYHFEYNKI
ncbi:ATPase [Halocola ammonii]